jgi:hypothetical protein
MCRDANRFLVGGGKAMHLPERATFRGEGQVGTDPRRLLSRSRLLREYEEKKDKKDTQAPHRCTSRMCEG